MAKQKSDLIDDIKKDLIKYSSSVAKFAAIEVRDELYKSAKDAIEAFYLDYEPEYYYRNYYNFKTKSFQKFYHDSHGKTFSGGIILTPDLMDDLYRNENGYGATAEMVFESVYAGWHGLPGEQWHGIRMKNGPQGYDGIYPMDVINNTYNKLLKDTSLLTRAEKKADYILTHK